MTPQQNMSILPRCSEDERISTMYQREEKSSTSTNMIDSSSFAFLVGLWGRWLCCWVQHFYCSLSWLKIKVKLSPCVV